MIMIWIWIRIKIKWILSTACKTKEDLENKIMIQIIQDTKKLIIIDNPDFRLTGSSRLESGT